MRNTDLKIGDKVNLEDIERNKAHVLKAPQDDASKAEIKAYNKWKKDYALEYNGYVVTDIAQNFVECTNKAMAAHQKDRTVYYGRSDLHLITKVNYEH